MPQYDLAGNPLPGTDVPPRDGQGNLPPAGASPFPTVPMRYDLAGNPLPGSPTPAPRSDPAGNPPSAAPVRYDLAGNPLPAAPAPAATPAYNTAPAYSGTWPPAPQPAGGYQRPERRNNSGEQGDVPPEVAALRWNWGAFFWPIFWARKHGMTTLAAMLVGGLFVLRLIRMFLLFVNPALMLLLYCVYGVTYFAIQVYFGINGHQIGWRNRRFDGGFEEFIKVQRAWLYWGLALNVVLPVFFWMAVLGGIVKMGSSAGHYGSGPPSGYGSPAGGYGTPGGYNPDGGSPGGDR